MNVVDKLYTEWAWRSKSGTPDINNPEDKNTLNKLIAELTDTDGEISKQEVINAIKKGDFTPEQLQTILNGISSVAYKSDILDYLRTKGKAVIAVSKYVYNELVDHGDVQNFHLLLDKLPTYDSLGKSGNLFKSFAGKFSMPFLRYLMDKKPAISNIATGKGEIFLGVLVSDVTTDSPNGDINGGGKDIEIKNKDARPAGQKFAFGKNVDKVMIKLIVEHINKQLEEPLDERTFAGKRPFHRINLILNKVVEENPELIDEVLTIADQAISRIYVGLDLTDLSLKKYKQGNKINADEYELEFCRRIVRMYASEEGFEEVLFLDDKTGNFVKVPASSLDNLLGKKIDIKMKDGLPKWSYIF